jgi:excisionase family DNA binding protein
MVDRDIPASALKLYTPEQAAELLQVSPSWLRRKATARAVACTFIGKHLRFSTDDLKSIIAAGTTGTASQQRKR